MGIGQNDLQLGKPSFFITKKLAITLYIVYNGIIEREETKMRSTERKTTIKGKEYKVWSDFIIRGTFAEDENGVTKCIRSSGYLSNDLAIRKAIARAYALTSFRK